MTRPFMDTMPLYKTLNTLLNHFLNTKRDNAISIVIPTAYTTFPELIKTCI